MSSDNKVHHGVKSSGTEDAAKKIRCQKLAEKMHSESTITIDF